MRKCTLEQQQKKGAKQKEKWEYLRFLGQVTKWADWWLGLGLVWDADRNNQ